MEERLTEKSALWTPMLKYTNLVPTLLVNIVDASMNKTASKAEASSPEIILSFGYPPPNLSHGNVETMVLQKLYQPYDVDF